VTGVLSDLIEAMVGVACLIAGWLAWRRLGLGWVAAVAGATLGLAAIGHAVWSLATG
jgi:hypothetical protein